jgi:hypothetical protein
MKIMLMKHAWWVFVVSAKKNTIHGDSPGGSPELIIINHIINARPVRTVPFSL